MKIAVIGDLHTRSGEEKSLHTLFDGIKGHIGVLVLTGDLTDNGQEKEGETCLKVVKSLKIPTVAVLGNHDFESGKAEELIKMFSDGGFAMLDGTSCEVEGIGFVGTKGFCGGFDTFLVQPFGEQVLKTFIMAGIDEAIALENAVAKMTCEHKIAVLHYAPVKDTLQGESPELYAFLGCSRLANALDRQKPEVIFHGHAHNGNPTGRTPGNIPVFNTSRFVLSRAQEKPYCIYEIPER